MKIVKRNKVLKKNKYDDIMIAIRELSGDESIEVQSIDKMTCSAIRTTMWQWFGASTYATRYKNDTLVIWKR